MESTSSRDYVLYQTHELKIMILQLSDTPARGQALTSLDAIIPLLGSQRSSPMPSGRATTMCSITKIIKSLPQNHPALETCRLVFAVMEDEQTRDHDMIAHIHGLLENVLSHIGVSAPPVWTIPISSRIDILDKVLPAHQHEVAKTLDISAFDRLMHLPAIPLTFVFGDLTMKESKLMDISVYFDLINLVLADGRADEIAAICKRLPAAVALITYRRAVCDDDDRIAEVFGQIAPPSVKILTLMIDHNHKERGIISSRRAIIFHTAMITALK